METLVKNPVTAQKVRKAPKEKQARIEIRPTLMQKEMLEYAAQLRGTTLASFLLTTAMEKAETVMESHNRAKAIMETRRAEISEEAKSLLNQVKEEFWIEPKLGSHQENVREFINVLEDIHHHSIAQS